MALISRGALPEPAAPAKETVPVEELGGDVEVRGLMLNEKLRCHAIAGQNDGRIDIAQLLADTVYDAEGERVWSREQWAAWGANNAPAATALAVVAMRLSGLLPDEIEKKPETPSDNSSSS
jgi:hypothetical protein